MLVVLFAAAWAQASTSTVSIVGEFSNMRHTEEHAYGFTVQLWRKGAEVFGLFMASAGLAGDTPTGLLENIKYDARTGRLTFSARLTTGVVIMPNRKEMPSRDYFEFQGVMYGAALTGVLTRSDQLRPGDTKTTEQVRLRKLSSTAIVQHSSYEEWKKSANEILRFRGPKW
jgi:hypothetical protein